MNERLHPDFEEFLRACTRKVNRLGIAYMESGYENRHELSKEVGEPVATLSRFAHQVRKYFPLTHPKGGLRPEWTPQEEATLFDGYQTTTQEQLQQILPARTWGAIQKRASQMGLIRRHESQRKNK